MQKSKDNFLKVFHLEFKNYSDIKLSFVISEGSEIFILRFKKLNARTLKSEVGHMH